MRKGSKTIRIQDVAREAGVSAATVSYVLNGQGKISPKTRERVLEVVQRLRYRPSAAGRDLASRSAHAVGIIMPREDSLSDPFFATVSSGFMLRARQRDYQVVLLGSGTHVDEVVELVEGKRLDGVLLLEVESDDERAKRLFTSDVPLLLFGRSDLPVTWLDVDNLTGGILATQHLLDLGHRRIAHIAAPQKYLYGLLRRRGYEEALSRYDAGLVPIVVEGDLTMEAAYRLTRDLLVNSPRPTAIFAASDLMAIGVIRAASELGLHVPHDLSVIGYDDSYLAREFIPQLTTIGQKPHLLGEMLAEGLIERLGGRGPRQDLLTPELVVRETTVPVSIAPYYHRSAERITIKSGPSFSLWSDDGFIDRRSGNQGIYAADTHWLSHYQLLINGVLPSPTMVDVGSDRFSMRYVVTLKDGTLDLVREVQFRPQSLTDSWHWTRWGDASHPWSLELRHAVDFRDIFELRGFPVELHGTIQSALVGKSAERHQYQGRDGVSREFSLSVEPPPATNEIGLKTWVVAPNTREGRVELNLAWTLPPSLSTTMAPRDQRWPEIRTENPHWDRVLRKSQRDLEMLISDYGQGPILMAGLPWFGTFFGRDALISAYQILWARPDIAEATLATMAQLQGNITDPDRSEMPGKMVHEVRLGELSNLGMVPFGRYYGSVDVTPLFVSLLYQVWRMTGRHALLNRYLPVARRAMDWMQQALASNQNGLLTFHSASDRGLTVQSWKDSSDSMVYGDGRQADQPLAVAEVQGYVFQSLLAMAAMEESAGDAHRADAQRAMARRLQETFHRGFWMDKVGYYAMAVDPRGRQLEVLSSDAGQCLWTGIVPSEFRADVVSRLTSPELFSGWGIRTLGEHEAAYDPYSYHRGSVWPHDTSLVVAGMAAFGFCEEAATVADGLVAAADALPDHRLPELFSGLPRTAVEEKPLPYPYACAPQAWAAGAPWLMLKSLLQMDVDGALRVLTIGRAPRILGRVTIRNWTMDGGQFDLDVGQDVRVLNQPAGWTVRVREPQT